MLAAQQTIDNFAFLASNSIFRHEGMEGVRKISLKLWQKFLLLALQLIDLFHVSL